MLILFIIVLGVFLLWVIIAGKIEEKRKQEEENARRQLLHDTLYAYRNALDQLESNPTDPKLRRYCLDKGRQYARLCREGGAETTFDELSIKNDIDAACAAAGTAHNQFGSAVTRPPIKQVAKFVDATTPTNPKKSSPIRFLGCGCLALVLGFCVIGMFLPQPINHAESTSKRSSATKVRKSVKRSKLKGGSVESVQSNGVIPDKAQLTGKKLIAKLERLGYVASVKWKKSKIDAGWIGIWHLKNANAPDDLLNEVSVQLIGATGNQIDKAIIEAEIYDEDFKESTMKNGVACIKLLSAPGDVVKAFQSGEELENESWEISRAPHAQGGGYDIECIHKFVANETNPQPLPSKSAAKNKSSSDSKSKTQQLSHLKQYRAKLNASGLNEQIITRLSGSGTNVTITVVDAWSEMDYNSRLEAATTLYKLWALTASPDSPDSARISIQTEGGTKIGGSRMLAGSLIWVQK